MRKRSSEVRYPETRIRLSKRTSFSSFWMHSGSKRLQNTAKYHFGSNGGCWVCSCENVRRKFGTPKQWLRVPKQTSLSLFCMHSGSQMRQSSPKHHFGSNVGYWMCSCENIH